MRSVLLDTHTWLWFITGSPELKLTNRKLIDHCLTTESTFVASISCWEIAMLESKQRIKLSMPANEWMQHTFKLTSLIQLDITPAIAYESCHLPGDFHGDPADRLITATARVNGLELITRDKQILLYSKQNYVNTISA